MDLKQKSEPLVSSLFEMWKFTESKGYEVIPFKVSNGYKFLIVKEGIVIKKGVQRYKNMFEGEKIVLDKLCKALGL